MIKQNDAVKTADTITPAEELERLAKHIREASTRRAAREEELNEIMRKSPLDMLEDSDAVSEDAARIQTQLALIDRALTGANQRCHQLYPLVAAEIDTAASEIQRIQAETMETIYARESDALASHFSPDALPYAVNRTLAVCEQVSFNASHRPTSNAVNMVFGGGMNPQPIPSIDNNPVAVANALRTARQRLEATKERAEEVRQKYANTKR